MYGGVNMKIAASRKIVNQDLPADFMDFFLPLHQRFTKTQQQLKAKRALRLNQAHAGDLPNYLPASDATTKPWSITLPAWCQDQRNQMTGPADDAALVVKMLNSGAPGVMLDLEDSMVNRWDHSMLGHQNIVAALYGQLTYHDAKRGGVVSIKPSDTVVWTRVRGLHMAQSGLFADEQTSASLFDIALLTYQLEYSRLKHPLCIYIPKSESAEEALWWKQVFDAVIEAKKWQPGSIKAMALIESHPIAFEMEEFFYNLRDYLIGLNLGRWDYMASLIHFNMNDPNWLLPDRNTIPLDVPFFQHVRMLLPEIMHKHGGLAIGGMTALFPSRDNPELNARALDVLARDKKNEASCLMDGAWTGHPDQNDIAVAQFPKPNQIHKHANLENLHPNLRPVPKNVGATTLDGTRAAVRTVIRYRHGVLEGRGASLLDNYMEDLATDRIYRLMIAQRVRYPGEYTPTSLKQIFNEELQRIMEELPAQTADEVRGRYHQARELSEQMILSNVFDPS